MGFQDSNQTIVLAKYGAAPAATDVLDVNDPEKIEASKKPAGGNYKPASGRKGSKKNWVNNDNIQGSVNIPFFLRGNDTTGTALNSLPGYSEMLKICGLTETIDSGAGTESVTYTPSQDDPSDQSVVVIYRDGEKDTITQALGTLEINANAGEQMQVSASVSGYVNGKPVAEANPAYVEDGNSIIVLKSTDNFKINGVARTMVSIKLSGGNMINPLYCVGAKKNFLTDFEPYIEVTYLADDSNDAWDLLTEQTRAAVELVAGATNGKNVSIKAYAATVDPTTPPQKTNLDGKLAYKIKMTLEDNLAEPIYEIKYGTVV